MSERHTPGPWEAKEEYVHGRNGYGLICEVIDSPEGDARLIAAAPEMLEALEQIDLLVSGLMDPPMDMTWDQAIKAVCRQAIAKATEPNPSDSSQAARIAKQSKRKGEG
jgi:hypothetical protein